VEDHLHQEWGIVTDAALVIAVIAIVGALVAVVQVQGVRRKLDAVPSDGDVYGLLQSLTATSDDSTTTIAQMESRLLELEGRLPYAISYVGVVAYNAFGNIAGQQSRSIALLNQRGDGIVITLLSSREETLFFTKQVAEGVGAEMLSPEESAAVDRALGR
jgi:hypothetical protein